MILGSVALTFLNACSDAIQYPETAKGNDSDDYFGTLVPDPYRWLENDTAADVKAWVQAENAVTDAYLSRIPFRGALQARLEQLLNYDTETPPFYAGKYFLFYRKTGLSNQSVLYIQDSLKGEPRVLLDPNTLSADGTVALGGVSISRDSRYMAYAIADGGSDWRTIHVMEIESGRVLDDQIRWVKFSSMAWQGNGFYYSCYDAPEEGKELSTKNQYHKVYYHQLGTPQSSDRLVFENREHPLRNFSAQTTKDEQFLIISETESTDGNALYLRDLQRGSDFVQLAEGFDYDFSVVGNQGRNLFVLTNYKAPKYRLVRIDVDRADTANWIDIVPESDNVLTDCVLAGGKVVATHMADAASRMALYPLDPTDSTMSVTALDLGVLGTVGSISGEIDKDDIFFSYTSFIVPSVVYRLNVNTGEKSDFFYPTFDFDFSKYKVEQVFYASKDGTRVPMFLVYRGDIERNGKNPTLLYGYGGFNISLTPWFSAARLAWLEQGGVYAIANLRGGGEYGEAWHEAGTKLRKQNVFDDCIAAAEYLIAEKITSPACLAVQGGSNGGLLVGAVVNQRPDLFAVAIPQVGVMDMLRYQHFTIGWAWAGDYGTSDDQQYFETLYGYSPLHNIRQGDYPAILVTTADHDDRVVPAHSFKYIATLQEKLPGGKPKLIRIETRAGHGAGKPTALAIAEIADIYAFAWYNMGVEPKYESR